jgi:hypothetical protein
MIPGFIINVLYSLIIKITNRMNHQHHHFLNFYSDSYPQLSTNERASSLIGMQQQIQQLLTTRNDVIDKKDIIGTNFQINTNFDPTIDYQTAYTTEDLVDAINNLTPAFAQGQEYQSSYKRK